MFSDVLTEIWLNFFSVISKTLRSAAGKWPKEKPRATQHDFSTRKTSSCDESCSFRVWTKASRTFGEEEVGPERKSSLQERMESICMKRRPRRTCNHHFPERRMMTKSGLWMTCLRVWEVRREVNVAQIERGLKMPSMWVTGRQRPAVYGTGLRKCGAVKADSCGSGWDVIHADCLAAW